MRADRVFLHVGHNKTGTTALQRTFRKAHRSLAESGVLYPRAFSTHRYLRDFIRGDAAALAMEGNFRREFRATTPSTLIFSSEFLNNLNHAEAARLIAFASEFGESVTVVLYVRHPLDYARSAVQQAVRKLR